VIGMMTTETADMEVHVFRQVGRMAGLPNLSLWRRWRVRPWPRFLLFAELNVEIVGFLLRGCCVATVGTAGECVFGGGSARRDVDLWCCRAWVAERQKGVVIGAFKSSMPRVKKKSF
jgi:hypothetical protein